MTSLEIPEQHAPQAVNGSWAVLPSWLPVPGMGVLPVNSFLLTGPEPMLVDTGLSALSEAFVGELGKCIDPQDLSWVWLSHTDADHIGNVKRLLQIAPNATVVTNFLGAGKMGIMDGYDLSRVRLLEPGEVFEVSGRRLHQVKPPYYDAPETMGFFDEADRVLFTADAFGALLPEPVAGISDVGDEELRDGLVGWSSVDAPWLAGMDQSTLGKMVRDVENLAPEVVLSGHLPVARGVGQLTGHIARAYCRGTTADVTADGVRAVEAAIN